MSSFYVAPAYEGERLIGSWRAKRRGALGIGQQGELSKFSAGEHFLLPQNRGMRPASNVLPTHDMSDESDVSSPSASQQEGRGFLALLLVTQA